MIEKVQKHVCLFKLQNHFFLLHRNSRNVSHHFRPSLSSVIAPYRNETTLWGRPSETSPYYHGKVSSMKNRTTPPYKKLFQNLSMDSTFLVQNKIDVAIQYISTCIHNMSSRRELVLVLFCMFGSSGHQRMERVNFCD